MPLMIMPRRDRTITTVYGQSIQFEKGKPTHVPPIAVKDCVAAGAVPAEGEDEKIETAAEVLTPKAKDPLAGEARVEAIAQAVASIKNRNVATEFTASGHPKVSVVSTLVGFPVVAAEVTAAWDALTIPQDDA